MRFILALLLVIFFSLPAFANITPCEQQALKAAGEQADSRALATLRIAAKNGDAKAQFTLGEIYDGRQIYPRPLIERNYEEAIKWYRMAADQGDAEAQDTVGWMYERGQGVKQDTAEAARWHQKAKNQGFPFPPPSAGLTCPTENQKAEKQVSGHQLPGDYQVQIDLPSGNAHIVSTNIWWNLFWEIVSAALCILFIGVPLKRLIFSKLPDVSPDKKRIIWKIAGFAFFYPFITCFLGVVLTEKTDYKHPLQHVDLGELVIGNTTIGPIADLLLLFLFFCTPPLVALFWLPIVSKKRLVLTVTAISIIYVPVVWITQVFFALILVCGFDLGRCDL